MEAAYDCESRTAAFDFLRNIDSHLSSLSQLSRRDIPHPRRLDRHRCDRIEVSEQFVYITTTGRKTGLAREIEIWFVELEGRLYILAEYGLEAKWVQNILADPNVTVRRGDRQYRGVGRVLDKVMDIEKYARAQAAAREKYGWGEGLPVEIVPAD
jgi:deazaflavin-dependent oxidoreductase (nitroreductase family)